MLSCVLICPLKYCLLNFTQNIIQIENKTYFFCRYVDKQCMQSKGAGVVEFIWLIVLICKKQITLCITVRIHSIFAQYDLSQFWKVSGTLYQIFTDTILTHMYSFKHAKKCWPHYSMHNTTDFLTDIEISASILLIEFCAQYHTVHVQYKTWFINCCRDDKCIVRGWWCDPCAARGWWGDACVVRVWWGGACVLRDRCSVTKNRPLCVQKSWSTFGASSYW